jgi:hypothetical protein
MNEYLAFRPCRQPVVILPVTTSSQKVLKVEKCKADIVDPLLGPDYFLAYLLETLNISTVFTISLNDTRRYFKTSAFVVYGVADSTKCESR